MIFNFAETATLTAAIETYDERPRNQLRWEVQHSLSLSVLNKLEKLTALTVFNKQEFTLMLLAVDHLIGTFEKAKQPVDPVLNVLYDRLLELARPDTH